MACHIDPTDPANLSPAERVAEIAAILAEGVERLRHRAAIPVAPENPGCSGDGRPVPTSVAPASSPGRVEMDMDQIPPKPLRSLAQPR